MADYALAEMLGGGAMEGEADEGGTDVPPLPLDDFGLAAQEAFPDATWTPERLDAIKEMIRLAVEEDQAGGLDDAVGKPKGDAGLALIFEGPEKKKK